MGQNSCRGFTHRGTLGASGSLRTSHSSRTLGRREGNEVWWTLNTGLLRARPSESSFSTLGPQSTKAIIGSSVCLTIGRLPGLPGQDSYRDNPGFQPLGNLSLLPKGPAALSWPPVVAHLCAPYTVTPSCPGSLSFINSVILTWGPGAPEGPWGPGAPASPFCPASP